MECVETRNGKKIKHRLDLAQVDQLDERSGDEQLAFVWCEIHKDHEWHWLEIDLINGGY
ncbi:hypothetical protein VH564_15870 [Rhizobium sp. HT1-10]